MYVHHPCSPLIHPPFPSVLVTYMYMYMYMYTLHSLPCLQQCAHVCVQTLLWRCGEEFQNPYCTYIHLYMYMYVYVYMVV